MSETKRVRRARERIGRWAHERGRAYAIRLEALFAERDGDRIMSQGLRRIPTGGALTSAT